MSDYRVVQCFGTKRRPRKPEQICRERYLWIAVGTHGNFGRRGTHTCPNCGNLPDFTHPINRMLGGEISSEEAEELLLEEKS